MRVFVHGVAHRGELERIADQTINICQNARFVLEAPPLKPLVDLPIMADVAQAMVRDALTRWWTKTVGWPIA